MNALRLTAHWLLSDWQETKNFQCETLGARQSQAGSSRWAGKSLQLRLDGCLSQSGWKRIGSQYDRLNSATNGQQVWNR